MKKLLCFAIACLFAVALVACGSEKDPDLQSRIDSLQEQIHELEQSNSALTESNKKLEERNKALEEELSGYRQDNSDIEWEEIPSKVAYCNMNLNRPYEYSGFFLNSYVHKYSIWEEISCFLPEFESGYDEAFFAENSLFVFVLDRGAGGGFNEAKVLFNGNDVKICVDGDEGVLDSRTEWAIVIEVKKTDMLKAYNYYLETTFRSSGDYLRKFYTGIYDDINDELEKLTKRN